MDRQCKKCGVTKPMTDFYRHHQSRSGRMTKCMECARSDTRANRLVNLDYYRAYDRERGARQDITYVRSYRASNPAKYTAHNAVNNAIRDGRLIKPSACEQCFSTTRVHGHHDDYCKPLSVRWLCAACHKAWHQFNDAVVQDVEQGVEA